MARAAVTIDCVYELVIRVEEDDRVVIEPLGRLDERADRHILECVAAANDTGLTPHVRQAAALPPRKRPRRGPNPRR